MKKKILILLSVFLIVLIGLGVYAYFYISKPITVESIDYGKVEEDKSYYVTIKVNALPIFETKCSIDNGKTWSKTTNATCKFRITNGDYKLIVKNKTQSGEVKFTSDINEVTKIKLNIESYHLALEETFKLKADVDALGNPDQKITYSVEDDQIATVSDEGVITGKKVGETNVYAQVESGKYATAKIIVTDLIVKPEYNINKPYLPCKAYTKEEAAELDEILAERVELAGGAGTRGATIAAARFLTLSFKYRVHYFFENGRLDYPTSGLRYVDGEGRYHHKGLYLDESKYDELDQKGIYAGPAIWGCGLTNYDTEYGWKAGAKYDNGLDCSGFVTWALYQGGTDVGDIGAGIKENVKEMSDIGEMHTLTYDFVNSDKYKIGDIIARWGHTAIIAGKDDKYIYIAESLLKGVRMERYNYVDKKSVLYTKGWYTYINTMDNVYTGEGEYTTMF